MEAEGGTTHYSAAELLGVARLSGSSSTEEGMVKFPIAASLLACPLRVLGLHST